MVFGDSSASAISSRATASSATTLKVGSSSMYCSGEGTLAAGCCREASGTCVSDHNSNRSAVVGGAHVVTMLVAAFSCVICGANGLSCLSDEPSRMWNQGASRCANRAMLLWDDVSTYDWGSARSVAAASLPPNFFSSEGTGITHSHGIATAHKIQEATEVCQ